MNAPLNDTKKLIKQESGLSREVEYPQAWGGRWERPVAFIIFFFPPGPLLLKAPWGVWSGKFADLLCAPAFLLSRSVASDSLRPHGVWPERPLSIGFSRRMLCPPPGVLSEPGTESVSLASPPLPLTSSGKLCGGAFPKLII